MTYKFSYWFKSSRVCKTHKKSCVYEWTFLSGNSPRWSKLHEALKKNCTHKRTTSQTTGWNWSKSNKERAITLQLAYGIYLYKQKSRKSSGWFYTCITSTLDNIKKTRFLCSFKIINKSLKITEGTIRWQVFFFWVIFVFVRFTKSMHNNAEQTHLSIKSSLSLT